MAIRSVPDIVKGKLPWLDDDSKDDLIESLQSEMYHLMEKHLGQEGEADNEIENSQNYSARQNMLIAEMVAYEMMRLRIIEVMGGGSGTTAGIQKMLKKAKADVVESEFVQVDTSKGSFTLPTKNLLEVMLKSICDMSRDLSVEHPWCFDPSTADINAPMIIGCDFPSYSVDPYASDIFSGRVIGGG